MTRLLLFLMLILPTARLHAEGGFMSVESANGEVHTPHPQAVSPRGSVRRDSHKASAEKKADARTEANNCPTCQPGKSRLRLDLRTTAVRPEDSVRGPRSVTQYRGIWNLFAHNFAICAPGCQPTQMGVHRPEDGKMSCHHMNRAIDVGGMVCGGRLYTALGGGRFKKMVNCVRARNDSDAGRGRLAKHGEKRLRTIYQQAAKLAAEGITGAHYDHAHFSLGCYGGYFY